MLLRIHVVPARRDRFEVRVRAAAEQLARRLARGLSSAPGFAGEGHATRVRGSSQDESQRHCLCSSVQCAACAAAILMRFRLQFDSCACADVFYGCAVQAGHCYMLCKGVQPSLAFASVLQAASCFGAVFLLPGLATTRQRSHCTAAAIDGGRQKPSFLAQTCAKIAHKYLVARGNAVDCQT